MGQNNTYVFGPFRLDTGTQLLCNEVSCVNLTPKVYRLLLYFLLHPGRLISHEELFETVWDGRIVDDSALRLAINSLRNALHDESKSPHYISTVCKKGYRFLTDVTLKECCRTAEASEAVLLHYRPQAHTSPAGHEHTRELAALLDLISKILQLGEANMLDEARWWPQRRVDVTEAFQDGNAG